MSATPAIPAPTRPDADADAERADEGRQSARLRNGLISVAVLGAIVVGLILAVPGLHGVARRLGHASPGWLAAGAGLELLSCLGYVVFFQLAFDRGPRRFTARVAWTELAANAVIPAGGAGGLGIGGWILHAKGMPTRRVAERSIVVFLGTSAVNAGALALLGLGLATGVLAGTRDPLLTVLPAAIAVAGIALVGALPWGARRIVARHGAAHRRLGALVCTLAVGVCETAATLRRADWRVLGAVGYWAFDVAVLWAAFHAIGGAPAAAVIAIAYLVGQLAGELPIPGGAGVVDGGLIGALALYGVELAPATAAVLAYRAISLWLPALIGTIDFVLLRRTLGEPVELVEPRGAAVDATPACSAAD